MKFHLDIPESVSSSLRIPIPEVEPRLRTELAVALYALDILPFGKACELAESTRYAFADLIAKRNIPRHYTEDDLLVDVDYARGRQYLADFDSCHHRAK
jgi:predicted HTH domain antitoxin